VKSSSASWELKSCFNAASVTVSESKVSSSNSQKQVSASTRCSSTELTPHAVAGPAAGAVQSDTVVQVKAGSQTVHSRTNLVAKQDNNKIATVPEHSGQSTTLPTSTPSARTSTSSSGSGSKKIVTQCNSDKLATTSKCTQDIKPVVSSSNITDNHCLQGDRRTTMDTMTVKKEQVIKLEVISLHHILLYYVVKRQ